MGEGTKTMSEEGEVKMRNKMLILLSHYCKEPPGDCFSARAHCCCRMKTFRQKLQLRDYGICSEEILQLLATLWINKEMQGGQSERRLFLLVSGIFIFGRFCHLTFLNLCVHAI